jgi:hypothetical protein
MQLEFVGCNFTNMERLSLYHSLQRIGDQIVSTRGFKTIGSLDYTHFAY